MNAAPAAADSRDNINASPAGVFTPPAAGRSFKIDEIQFEGPLDVLLFLIKKNEKNIFDIPIAQITEQYLDFLRHAEYLDLNDASEFHTMAALLLYIKSRSLLPVEMENYDDEDPRQMLVERLIEYQKYKKLSELMEDKEHENEWSIERQKLEWTLPFSDTDMWERIEIWDLMNAFTAIIRRMPGERIFDLNEEITINEKMALILELLETRGKFIFSDLIIRSGSNLDVVCSLLALLDAAKNRIVSIFQHRLFGDIEIRAFTNE